MISHKDRSERIGRTDDGPYPVLVGTVIPNRPYSTSATCRHSFQRPRSHKLATSSVQKEVFRRGRESRSMLRARFLVHKPRAVAHTCWRVPSALAPRESRGFITSPSVDRRGTAGAVHAATALRSPWRREQELREKLAAHPTATFSALHR